MLPIIIWIGGMALEGLLLIRGWRNGTISKFPLFFFYIGLIFIQSVLLYFEARFYPVWYPGTYWAMELVDVFAGCAVVVEIYRTGLAPFPGVKKVARNALLFIFCLTIGRVFLTAQQGWPNWSTMMTVQLERDMRFVEIGAVITLLLSLMFYSVPLGRNLGGILFGYGLFLGVNILNLTLIRTFGSTLQSVASYVQSLSYLVVLCVWVTALWAYFPRTIPESTGCRVRTYEAIYAETRSRLGKTRETVKGTVNLP